MFKAALAFTVLAALPLAAAADVTKEDIRKLVGAGISDDVIVTFIRSNGPVTKLSADDVVELKQAGASEKVLNAMMGGPAPRPQVQERVVEKVVERPVYTSNVVYTTPTYYDSSRWCSSHYSYDSCVSYGYYRPYYSPSYYYSSCYPRYYYPRSSYYYGGYGYGYSRSRYCGPRVGFGVRLSW